MGLGKTFNEKRTLPARLENAGQLAFRGQLAQAQAAQAKLTIIRAGTTAQPATVMKFDARKLALSGQLAAGFFLVDH